MSIQPTAVGRVSSLAENGNQVDSLLFCLQGPEGDVHSGFSRQLSGHDGEYISTSALVKGCTVANTRSWTALSSREVSEVEGVLGCSIPIGCLLENLVLSGISGFSQIEIGSRLVFKPHGAAHTQAVLAVWEENGPCSHVGKRLADYHHRPELTAQFVKAAYRKRGLMGFVYSAGRVFVGDEVYVYPPVRERG